MKSARDAVFGARPLLAPRLVSGVLSSSSGWQRLPLIDPRFNDCQSSLYQLEALKPDKGYSDTLGVHLNCVRYVLLVAELAKWLAPKLVGICAWNVPRMFASLTNGITLDDVDRCRIVSTVSTIEEELFIAVYNGAASLMQIAAILSNQLDNEHILKLCIKLHVTADAWWLALERLRARSPNLSGAGNEYVLLVVPPSTASDTKTTIDQLPCYNKDALSLMSRWTRAQLAELWVQYYLPREDKQREYARMSFVSSIEYGLVCDEMLAIADNDKKVLDMDMFAAGGGSANVVKRLYQTAAVKRFYYLAQACLSRASEGGSESGHLLESAELSIKRASKSVREKPLAFEPERQGEIEADINALAAEHEALKTQLGYNPSQLSSDNIDLMQNFASSGDLNIPGLTQRNQPLSMIQYIGTLTEDVQKIAQALSTTLPQTQCEEWANIITNTSKIAELMRPKPLFNGVESPPLEFSIANTKTPEPSNSTGGDVPQVVYKLFAEKSQGFSAINRLGLLAKKFAQLKRDAVIQNPQTVELINEQFTALINMTALIFFPLEHRFVDKIVGLARTISERQWEMISSTYQTLITAIRTDSEVIAYMETLNRGQHWIREEFQCIEHHSRR